MHDFLTSDGWLIGEKWWVANKHLE